MRKLSLITLLVPLILICSPGVSAAQSDEAEALSGSLCLYEHDDFKGGKWCVASPAYHGWKTDNNLSNNYWTGTSRAVNNGASSMTNTTLCHAWLHDSYNRGGDVYNAQAKSRDADLTNNGMDNKVSSLHIDCR
ncbi:hypothetical protein [Pseudonocardia humida]|uniref:Peptidase inhibitor family I36 n=1 Tax=Pseudonocardia humida TaxID=2800819 RepID=A0ABT1A777_9PSEU|nr:hypothetical protein [Pseudonocardia humida]MCO1658873.1 hypothetical protein [Pseudonocardia humida]